MSENTSWRRKAGEQAAVAVYALKWLPLSVGIGAPVGLASAAFLLTLDWATGRRVANPWLLYLLPAAGALVGLVYHSFGGESHRGHDLLIEQIHEPRAGVPRRMGPLVFAGTVITHLFGGSAGREGTAVQMGGAISSAVGRVLGLQGGALRVALMAGVAAGFGSVFGTPLAGAVFALEVLAIGTVRYDALFPCLAASVAADWTCRAFGVHHTAYAIAPLVSPDGGFDALLALKAALAGAIFGLAGLAFAELTHALRGGFARLSASPVLRPVLGGLAVIALTLLTGTRDYLGLGVTSADPAAVTIVSSFHAGGAGAFSWAWKLLFTATTIASGFKGGEVTPLFYVGAALGNALSRLLSAPTDLFAGLGLVAVFAGAANTPLACTLMGIELFGAGHAVPVAIACFTAYLFSGHSGIYRSQKTAHRKGE
jgi:H+/Cl- antiporter ClcA